MKHPETESEPQDGHFVGHFDQDGKLIRTYFIPEPTVCPEDCPVCHRDKKRRGGLRVK